jgi:hypothetical protein
LSQVKRDPPDGTSLERWPPKLDKPMLRRRCHRLTTTLIVVLSLLFSQLALARYVCPGESSTAAMVAMMEAGQPCNGMDDEQPVLCHEHAAPLAQTFELTKLPVLAQPLLVQVVVLLFAPLRRLAGSVPASTADARPPPDPLFLSTLRLRV